MRVVANNSAICRTNAVGTWIAKWHCMKRTHVALFVRVLCISGVLALLAACSAASEAPGSSGSSVRGDACQSDDDCFVTTAACNTCGEQCGDRATTRAAKTAACKDAPVVDCVSKACQDSFSRAAKCRIEPQSAGEVVRAKGICILQKAANLERAAYNAACATAEDCVAVNTTFECASCGRAPDFAINKADADKFAQEFYARFGQFGCPPAPCASLPTPVQPLCTNQICTLPTR
jgi:hypothetical protein